MANQSRILRIASEGVGSNAGRHTRARLGFIVLAMEQTAEEDIYRHAPPGVGVHFTRVPMGNEPSVQTLLNTGLELRDAASLLLPDDPPHVVCYTCTAASLLIGEAAAVEAMSIPGRASVATTAAGASIRALKALNARVVAVVTPYPEVINEALIRRLTQEGIEVRKLVSLGVSTNTEVDRIDPNFLAELGVSLLAECPDAGALYYCCGAMRSIEVIEIVERRSGRAVVTSNQAILWDSLRMAGVADRIANLGSLFENH